VFTIKSDYGLSEISYDSIIEWTKNILLDRNILKENFYTTRFMMKSLDLEHKKKNSSKILMIKVKGVWFFTVHYYIDILKNQTLLTYDNNNNNNNNNNNCTSLFCKYKRTSYQK
jgi:hypothetical protein